ncbi:MAG: hypothetical protein NTW26_09190 [bacterium]|nr:hypothetical protein [bacterium]
MKTTTIIVLVLAALALANDGEAGDYYYWDDGTLSSHWAWYTGGNYWAVQFEQTYGDERVSWLGAMTYPDWPDEVFQGANMHAFEDLGGYPGSDLGYEYLAFTTGGEFEWVKFEDYDTLTTDYFYIAFQQIGNYPFCDSMGVDASSGTHNWTGYQGSWSPTTYFGDFMIRCCTGDVDPGDGPGPGVEAASWGELKAAYAKLESRIRGNRATRPDNPRIYPKNDAWRAIGDLY